MVTRHPIYETSEYSPAQKTITLLAITFALVIIAIVGNFIYEFIQTYRQWLTKGLFYLASVLGVALAILVASFTAYAVCMLMLRIETKRAEHNHGLAQIAAITANNSLFQVTSSQIAAGQVYLSEQRTDQGIVRFKSLPKHAKHHPKMDDLKSVSVPISENMPQPEIKTTLLSDIEPMQRLLLVGGQNSGKTTLLKHIAKQRSAAGSVLVLDSHNTAGKWPRDYRIIGHGRDYPAIEKELKNLVAVMDSRYKELAAGKVREREHELITVISDEWTTVSKNLQNLDAYLLPLLTESRKVGIDLILATHSQTAESLGLKGKADLKSAFDAVLILKNISGKRLVDLDNGESIINYHHCGQYQDDYVSRDFTNKLDAILNDDLIKSTAIVDKYYELIKTNSFSWNKLSKSVYGNSNGAKVAELKRILERHGIVVNQ